MTPADVIEVAVRGGAAGLALLLAVALARLGRASISARLGAVFALGASSYALISSPILWEAIGPAREAFRLLASFNAVLFWWFSTALFDDGFRWRAWRWAPAAGITLGLLVCAASAERRVDVAGVIAMQMLALGLLVHALVLAVRGLGPDLVEPRRRFRVALVALSGTLGVAIAVAELALLRGPIPDFLPRLQALALLALTFGFSLWALSARQDLFAAPERVRRPLRSDTPRPMAPEDLGLLDRLNSLMDQGVYTEVGLSVGGLAARLGAQEHRLRKVINQGLGYRNFTTFLNARRIADAKVALADPRQARRQILQIALDLGYGSIGPFNRAFRATTGVAPRDYRKQALAGGGADRLP